ncbi:CD2 antigen cytoplasmic tail-binding protein 2-like [Oscarella lobularis]|uniref:CD2 antigen cytoplasmic tail-binding protein 2-like n=1 Tax=Oscarella lobularis TaxID=121494 RepID=UPI0033140B22
MSAPKRRKVTFHDLEREDDPERKPIKPSRFKEKHSLDSDEEEDEGKESGRGVRLSDDEIEGEEERTIDFNEGGVRMTPFNLKEEMEEGYFDQSGHYIATKDSNQVDDNWLESVDWKQVHQKSTEKELDDLGGDEDDDDDEGQEDVNVLDVMKEMLELLRPGETVTKALRRLGGSDKKKKKRNIRSKYSLEETDEDNCDGDDGDKVGLLKLTELADRLLGAGHQDVYAFSYEKIAYEVKSGGGKEMGGSDEVNWYYKWENTDEAKAYGPYSSTQMMEWVDQDFFKNGVWVRKATDAEGNFYSSKRIDFGLYVE